MATASWSALASLPSQTISGPNFGSQAVSGSGFNFSSGPGGSLQVAQVTVPAAAILAMTPSANPNSTWPILIPGVSGQWPRVLSVSVSDNGGTAYSGGSGPAFFVTFCSVDLAHAFCNSNQLAANSFGAFTDTAYLASLTGNGPSGSNVYRGGTVRLSLQSGTNYTVGTSQLTFTLLYYMAP